MMKRIVAALAGLAALILPGAALAQCGGLFTAGYFCGNSAAGGGLAGAASPTAMFDRAFGGTNNSTVVRLGGVWTVLSSANSGVWITSVAGVPSISSTLPNAVQDNITRLGTIASIGAPLGATFGGTGQSSYAVGDLLFAPTTSTVGKLADVATGNAVISGGPNVAPSYGKIGLTTHVSGTLPLGNGGTAQTTAPLARASSGLNIDAITTHGDSIYTILSTDRVVATSAAFTASRTWTLPAANSVNAGQLLVVTDLAGGVTGTNTLVIARAGSDTINGGTSVTINAANNAFYLISDGSSKWTAQAQSAAPGTGTVTSVVCGTATITTAGTCAMPYFSAFLSANQTGISSGVFTKIQSNTKTGTASGQYDGVTNFRFTPTLAGTYLVTVLVSCDGTTVSGNCIAAIYKNGSVFTQAALPSTAGSSIVSYQVAMNGSTDFIEGFGRVTCASACFFDGGSGPVLSSISASYISP